MLPAMLALTAIGTAGSLYEGAQARGAATKSGRLQQQAQAFQEQRAKTDAVRQARIAYGQSQQSAANQGVAESSGAIGGQSSIQSQLGANLSFLDNYGMTMKAAGAASSKASSASSAANAFGDIASLGMAGYSNADAITKSFNKVFKPGG